jgi:hypothetical protein
VSTRVVTVVILALTFLFLPFGGAALSDSDASFIVKGGWNSVVGYCPQFGTQCL